MKKSVILMSALIAACGNIIAQNLNFTVTNHTGSWSITCATPSIQLSASSDFSSAVSYAWGGPIFPVTGSMVVLTVPGIYTVGAFGTNSATASQTFAIGVNTTAPSSAISPTFQTINCTVAAQGVTLNALSPSSGIAHQVYSPYGGMAVMNASASVYVPGAPGQYTYCLTDNANGCSTCKNFTITSSNDFPTFSLASTPAGFTLGCSTKSCTTANIINPQTNPIPGGSLSFTLLSPTSSSVLPGGVLSPFSTYSICAPGTWTAVTRDNASLCTTRVPFTVLQNTLAPPVSVNVPAQLLTCDLPQVTLTASSPANSSYVWTFPGPPGSQSGNTIVVNANFSAQSATSVATYTLKVTDNNNLCFSTTVIPIYQNIYPPLPKITAPSTTLTCITTSIILTNTSVSGIPVNSTVIPTPSLPVIAQLWSGPAPQLPLQNSTTYTASYPGNYTLVAKDQNNGCTSTTVIPIMDGRVYPVVNNPVVPPPVCLYNGTAAVTPAVSSSTINLAYSWNVPPTATVVGQNTPTLTTNTAGTYTIVVTNTLNGCKTQDTMHVIVCTGLDQRRMEAPPEIFPNPSSGKFLVSTGTSACDITVYDLLGTVICELPRAKDSVLLDISGHPSGIYLVSVKREGQSRILKIVKE